MQAASHPGSSPEIVSVSPITFSSGFFLPAIFNFIFNRKLCSVFYYSVLRKTITRITNIRQAAIIGRLNVEVLVNCLREKAGQAGIELVDDSGNKYVTVRPEWFNEAAVVNTIDIGEMLNRDEQPVHKVLEAIRKLNDKEILEVVAPFIPAPLLDKSLSLEFKHWLDKKADNHFKIYFSK